MSLGLDTSSSVSDVIVGCYLVIVLGLANHAARQAAPMIGRFTAYLIGWLVLFAAWPWLAGVYLPSTEVVTAVGPGLSHWWRVTWQAPYGLLWYLINTPLWRIGELFGMQYGLGWMGVLMALNIPFLYMFRNSELLTAYFMTSFFLWAVLPWDLSILWLVVIGFQGSSILPRTTSVLLAVIAKLPFGAPIAVWRYDFLNGQEHGTVGSAFVPGHVMPYLVLGAWSIAVLLKPYIRFLSLDSYQVGQEEHRGASQGDSSVTGKVESPAGTDSG